MILVFVILPVLLYVGIFAVAQAGASRQPRFSDGRVRSSILLPVSVAVLAAASGIFTLAAVRSPVRWPGHSQIAWIGVRGDTNGTLKIGGDPGGGPESRAKDTTMGWPLDYRVPAVHLERAGTGENSLSIAATGSGGFVREDASRSILNGEILHGTFQQDWVEDNRRYSFSVLIASCGPGHRSWLHAGNKDCLQVTENGALLTEGDESELAYPSKMETAIRLSGLVDQTVQRLRQEPGSNQDRDRFAEQAGTLERWAATVLLLPRCTSCSLSGNHEVHILTPQSPQSRSRLIAAGSTISVIWPRVTLTARTALDGEGRVSLLFQAPYRHSSPLPPDKADRLLIENTLSPGDVGFLLPLPASAGSTELLLHPPVKPSSSLLSQLPRSNVLSARAGNIELLFQVLQSVPHAFWPIFSHDGQCSLAVLVAWAWIWLLGGLWILATQRGGFRTKVCSMGLVLTVWTVLCVRFMLAFRFAVDPDHLDLFSVEQMREALDALCILPGAIALCCLIRERTRRETLLLLAPVVVLLVLFINGSLLIPHLWFPLRLPFAGSTWTSTSFWAFFAAILAIGGLALVAAARRQPGPRAASVVEELIDWEARGGFKNFLVALVAAIVGVAFLFILDRVLPLFLRSFLKEVVLVIVQVQFVRYGIECLDQRTGSIPRRWTTGPLVNWGALLIALFVAAPPALDDVGGILAGCGLLLPLAILAALELGRARTSRVKAHGVFGASVFILGFVVTLVILVVATPLGNLARRHSPAGARITHWLGTYAEGQELGARSVREHQKRSEEQELSQTNEQTWQNKAMIVLGDWTGVGFGGSPARRSAIPQHTLQADSTYSFFIASEYGQAGATALIVLFAMPLLLVVVTHANGAWKQAGPRLAIVLTSAFLLECLAHIAMNMELIPMTGRSMPLLSTHSLANTLRWLLLLGWAASLLGDDRSEVAVRRQPARASRRLWPAVAACIGVVALAGGMFAWTRYEERKAWRAAAGNGAAGSSQHPDAETLKRAALVFTRSSYMREARLAVAGDPPLVRADSDGHLHSSGVLPEEQFASMKFGEEVQRFNGLPDSQRLPSQNARATMARAFDKMGPAEFMNALWRDSQAGPAGTGPVPPALFRLDHETYADFERTHLNTAPPVIFVNPAFQNVVDFSLHSRADVATVEYADAQHAVWQISLKGGLAQFTMQRGADSNSQYVDLDARDGRLSVARNNGRYGEQVIARYTHCASTSRKSAPRSEEIGTFSLDSDGELTIRENMPVSWRREGGRPAAPLPADRVRRLDSGDNGITRTNACGLPDKLSIKVQRDTTANQLVGPAWADGEWRAVYKPGTGLTLLPELARSVQTSALQGHLPATENRKGYRLTLNAALQQLTQTFLERHAVEHFYTRNKDPRGVPPRAGVLVMDIASGEVLAMVGWPHGSGEEAGRVRKIGSYLDVEPADRWLESHAPAELRSRYVGERNFDALPVGSATKPIWAASSLATNPRLASLETTSPEEPDENEIFGIPIGKPWGLHHHPYPRTNLTTFLAFSDNRFQTRLNFAALADLSPQGGIVMQPHARRSARPVEFFDGEPGVPDFSGVGLGYMSGEDSPSTSLHGLDKSRLAGWLSEAFPVEVKSGTGAVRSVSFWTSHEDDDSSESQLAEIVGGISPLRTQLDLDRVTTAREFVSILLGGSTNRWSNVNLASGFFTALTGRAMVPHMIHIDPTQVQPAREITLPGNVPCLLRAGLSGVVMEPGGTANLAMKPAVNRFPSYEFFAKTGTLDVTNEGLTMSRIVVALVAPSNDRCPGNVKQGLLFSFFVEEAEQGTATRWANEFMAGESDEDKQRAAIIQDLMRAAAAPSGAAH